MTDKLLSPEKVTSKKKKEIVRSCAIEINDYSSWLRISNIEYRQALGNMGQNLNAMLSAEFVDVENDRKKYS